MIDEHNDRFALRNRRCDRLVPMMEPGEPRPAFKTSLERALRTPDPAGAAVRILLKRALAAHCTSVKEAGRDGSVCTVLVPDAAWTAAVRDEWQAWLRPRAAGPHRTDYAAWSPEQPGRRNEQARANQAVASAVAEGLHCFGVAADLEWLPPDLVGVADHRLVLPLLRPQDVRQLARELCGDAPSLALTPDQAKAVTPRLLLLARRPGQSADDYVRRLEALLARDAESKRSQRPETPRAAPTLDRLHGMDEAVAWGRELARDLQDYRHGKVAWSALDRGCLLSGGPGVGKTLFARALAATCDVPLVSGSYGQWLGTGGGHQGIS